ncbi:MAG TPA: STAS domain-containing protein [Actinophytocola sp.]|uniref:STAS domain-containing protein n=1 Tax=Actinophytocola sp. TaxID=1872138 RepID=UPI002DDDA5F0|nr:STAS domain-containing protein [Actinophytocola sp.]HEV2782279.1 STAS domain-containing protein [Actinophytocola sp.]
MTTLNDGTSMPDSPDVPLLDVVVVKQGDAVVLEVSGEVDMATAPRLPTHVLEAIDTRPMVLVIDLAAVHFFGSSGLAVLVDAQQESDAQTQLRIVASRADVLRPLQVTGLDKALALYATREDAVRDAATE